MEIYNDNTSISFNGSKDSQIAMLTSNYMDQKEHICYTELFAFCPNGDYKGMSVSLVKFIDGRDFKRQNI